MHGLLRALPALVIAIAAVVDIINRAIKASAASKSVNPAGQPQSTKSVKKVQPAKTATGYAGRQNQARLPDHARAMDSAGSRLASGAEYPSIVAERIADRQNEASFAAKVASLERSEPSRLIVARDKQPFTSRSSLEALQQRIADNAGEAAPIVLAVLFSEILGPPRSRLNRQR